MKMEENSFDKLNVMHTIITLSFICMRNVKTRIITGCPKKLFSKLILIITLSEKVKENKILCDYGHLKNGK